MTTCINCSTNFDSNYCPNCGTSAKIARIDKKFVLHEFQHGILHFEKGFLYTLKELLLSPGHSIRRFIQGNRVKFYKPIGFLIVCSIIYSVLSHKLNPTPAPAIENENIAKVFEWISEHYNYSNIIEILFISLTLKWFFKKTNYNYFENFVLLSYLTGFGMLIGAFLIIVAYLSKLDIFNTLFPIVAVFYTVWAIGQFYDHNGWGTYLKSFIAYTVGFLLFVVSAILFGVILDTLHVQL
jgi:hypothetical protein